MIPRASDEFGSCEAIDHRNAARAAPPRRCRGVSAIGGKWGKFSERELSDLKNEDDLAMQLVTKYGLEEDIALSFAAFRGCGSHV